MNKQCKNKDVIRKALAGSDKSLVCFVWNGEDERPTVALIKYIGGVSGNYIDHYSRSWLYADPVHSDDCFFIGLEVV